MNLSKLLKLQACYMILGIAYNMVSMLIAKMGGKPLSSTSPTLGIIALLVYGMFLFSGHYGYYKIYRLLMLVALFGLGYGGVIVHLRNYSNISLYASPGAWLLAITINIFGVVLNFIAFTGKYTTNGRLYL